MNLLYLRQTSTRLWSILLLLCLLALNLGYAQRAQAAPSGCSVIYNGGNGWVIDQCTTDTDPDVTAAPMTVFLNGVSKGNALLVRIYHKSQNDPGTPQVAVIYASGFVRLKQNADPSPSIPFGTSFILGPAYWPGPSTYHHNPQLTRLEIDTTWLPDSPLRMKALGTNDAFNVTYDMTLPPPRDRQTRLHVTQSYTANANVTIDATRYAEKQGFKLVQVSSMFINEGAPCDGGYTDCHDSHDIRFIARDLSRRQRDFSGLNPPSFIMSAPVPLGSTWLDVLHTDDVSWQSQTGAGTSGNTPNVRIVLDELPTAYTITPQGRISPTTDPTDDNVNVWLHDDRLSSTSWTIGKSDQIGYWLLAQDNPPDPWQDLGLRPGTTFLDFNGSYNCYPVKDPVQTTTAEVKTTNGYEDRSLQLNYNLGSANGNWAQVRCDFSPPLDLHTYDHLRFEWRGDLGAGNSLEIGLISPTGNIFARGYHHVTQHTWWGQMVIPFGFMQAWTPGTQLDPAQVSAMFVSVVKDPVADAGGEGSIAIDNLGAFNVASRTVPGSFETVVPNSTAAQAAANWLASQQQSTGLIKSWQEESTCVSHTYDQALALIVFASQGMWTQADALVNGLAAIQNADGSWFQSRDCETLTVQTDSKKWHGDIAWAVYALSRYQSLGGTHPQAPIAMQKGANWLATLVNPVDGCLVKDHDQTEATIDVWWAFQAAGADHADEAEKIKNCLLTYYWDNTMGRFKGGRSWQQPYLDNQTWGAAFLKAIGETEKARRALSYARDVLRLPAQGGQLFGFDGQGGPWSVWNEGTAQYIAVGGQGSHDLLWELLAQQEEDGAMVASPDEFNGGGVWTTRWHGVAPTAWLYNALCGEPFQPGNQAIISGNVNAVGAKLTYSNCGQKTVISDSSANYSITVPYGWSGTVTPSLAGVTFTPTNRNYTNLTTNQTAQNYTASVTLSGNAGVAGATLNYTGGSTVANGSGNYAITVPYGWSGTVTPSLASTAFCPASQNYANLTASRTLQHYAHAACPNFGSIGKWTASFDLSHGWTVSNFVRTVGDVSGDGRADLVGFGLDGVYVAVSNGAGFNPVSKWTSSFDLSHGWTVSDFVRTVGDVNGDGRADLIGFGLDGVYVSLSTGSNFPAPTKWTSSFDLSHGWTVSDFVRTVGDVNGDGRADLVGFGLDGVYVSLSTGSSFPAPTKWTSAFDLSHGWTVAQFVRTVGDVNGDGRADLVGFGLDGVYVATSTGSGFNAISKWTGSFALANGWTVSDFVRMVGDVNGDGKADIVGFGLDGVYIGLSTGTTFSLPSRRTTSFDLSHGWTVRDFVRTVGDVNGGGRADLVGFGLDGVYIALSQ